MNVIGRGGRINERDWLRRDDSGSRQLPLRRVRGVARQGHRDAHGRRVGQPRRHVLLELHGPLRGRLRPRAGRERERVTLCTPSRSLKSAGVAFIHLLLLVLLLIPTSPPPSETVD